MHCQTLPKILKQHAAPQVIDWLSLDVERAELEVLETWMMIPFLMGWSIRSLIPKRHPFGWFLFSKKTNGGAESMNVEEIFSLEEI